MTYNAEGGQLGGSYYGFNGSGWFPGHLIQATYTTRGEVVVDTSGPGTPSLYANGMRIQSARSVDPTTKTASFAFNALQGMTVATQSASHCAQGTCDSSTWGYVYDSVGRQSTAHFSGANADYINAKSYDAEDHLLVQTLPWTAFGKGGYQRSLGYRWGPAGHPLQVGSTSAVQSLSPPPTDFQYDTLVWDDDDLLFTLNSAGQIDDLKVGDFADYVPSASNPLTVWDRDSNGQIYGCHTGSGASSLASSAFQRTAIICGTQASFINPQFGLNQTPVGRGGMLLIQKSDGFSDGQNTFQGVRTYDPQAGVWTTPDAYHGNVHDPMSQKPYMWDANNPYEFSDPSGFDALIMIDPRSVAPLGHISMVIYDPKTMAGYRYESGPVRTGGVVHEKEKITIEAIADVRTLGNYGQDTYHFSSSAAQDKAMTKYWTDADSAAKAGTDKYNAFTNSCDDKVAGALAAGDQNITAFVGIPTITGKLLEASGHKVNPGTLKPATEQK